MISEKIGKADESKQFRKLFKEDDDFHGIAPAGPRDNWLVGKEWFEQAVDMVDEGPDHDGQEPAGLSVPAAPWPNVLCRVPGEGRHVR